MLQRGVQRLLMGLAALGVLTAGAVAQTFPSKQITIVVPFPAGAGPDVIARLLGERMASTMKEAVVIENRPGASGMVGATAVARAAPDGHTLLLTPNTLFIAPHVAAPGTKPPVDVIADFVPVIMPSQTTMLMVGNPKLGVKNAREFANLARAKNGLSYASSGNGSVLHIAGELFRDASKVDLVHVPYRGIAPAVNDVIAGHVAVTFAGLGPVREQIRAGALVALAVVEPNRSPSFPDVPTAIEQGFADVAVDGWYALLAPKGVPQAVIERLNKDVNAILQMPDIRERIEQSGEVVLGGPPEALAKRMRHDFERYGQIVRKLNITGD